MTTQRGRHRKLRRNILHTVIATALLAGTFTVADQSINPTPVSAVAPAAPTTANISVSADGTKINMKFTQTLSTNLPPKEQFKVTTGTYDALTTRSVEIRVTNVERTALDVVTLTLDGILDQNKPPQVQYTAPSPSNNSPDNAAIQNVAGEDVANFTVVSSGTQSLVPALVKGTTTAVQAAGNTLLLTFNANLAAAPATPDLESFTVKTNGSIENPVVSTSRPASTSILLTLRDGIEAGTPVTVSYSAPPVDNVSATNLALQGTVGNDVQSFTDLTVANTLSNVPKLNTAVVPAQGNTIALTFSKSILATSLPDKSQFSVTYGGMPVQISTVTASAAVLTLALATTVAKDLPVLVSYTPPTPWTAGTGNIAIQDSTTTGADALPFTNFAVNTTASTVPYIVSTSVATGGNYVYLNYNEDLENSAVKTASQFTLKVNGVVCPITETRKDQARRVYVRVDSACVGAGQTVTLSYTPSSYSNTTSPTTVIQNVAGADAPALVDFAITNTSTKDLTRPTLQSAVVSNNGMALALTFSEGLSYPNGTVSSVYNMFSVLVDGVAAQNSSITISARGSGLLTLGLSKPIGIGQVVTLSLTNSSNTYGVGDTSNNYAANFSNFAVTNNSTADVTAPVLQSIEVPTSGDRLILKYNEDMGSTLPAVNTTNFGVTNGGAVWLPTGISVSGSDVILTGPATIEVGKTVVLTKYTAPTPNAAPSNTAIQDTSGNDAASLTNVAVTNNSTLDITSPTWVSATTNADGDRVTLTFSEDLSSDQAPLASAFTIAASAGTAPNVTATSISGKTVVLTLSAPVQANATLTFNYEPPNASLLNGLGNAAIQDLSGNDAATQTSRAITNASTYDTLGPVVTGRTVSTDGQTLTLTFNEAIANATAQTSDFVVIAAGVEVSVTDVAVSGNTVALSLGSVIQIGQAVTVSYIAPDSNPDSSNLAIQDTIGYDALGFTDLAVTNNSNRDTVAPVLSLSPPPTLAANGTTLTLTFSEALAAATASSSDFVVNVNGSPVTISSVTRPASPGTTIVLTLSTAVEGAQPVTVSYAAPSTDSANTNSAIQDTAGNDALTFSAQTVTNNSTQGRPVFAAIIVGTDGQTVHFCYNKSTTDSLSLSNGTFVFKVNGVVSSFWTNNGSNTSSCPVGTTAGPRWTQTSTTVRIGDVVTVSRTESGTGTSNLRTITDFPVTNNSTLLGRPGVTSIVVDSTGTNIRLNYDGTVPNPVPAMSDFQWSVNGQLVALTGSGTTSGTGFFAANINSKIFQGDVVTASYVQPNTNIATVKSFTNLAVTNNSTADGTPPSLASVANTADGMTLTLTFDEDLLDSSLPLTNQFAVTTNGYQTSVSSLAVSGRTVVLNLASPIGENATASVTYTAPAFSRLTSNSAVQDAPGNDSATFTGDLSTNLSTVNQGPMLVSSTVNNSGTAIVLIYDETLSGTTAPTSAFSATANGVAVNITGVTINGSTVTLAISPTLEKSDAIQVAYAAPSLDQTFSNSAIQGLDGFDAASFALTDVTTNSSSVDTKGPVLSTPVPTISTSGSTLTLTFNEDLGQATAPASSFTVLVDGVAVVPSSVSIVNNQAVLNFSPVLGAGRLVTVAYSSPGVDNSTSDSALQDVVGNNALSFAAQAVTNNSTIDNTGPVLSLIARPSLAANGTTLTLTYNEDLAAAIAAGSAFTVMNGTTPVSVSAISRPTATTIQLTLASAVYSGTQLTVAYSAPSSDAGTSNSAVQDILGNDSVSFTAQSVTNNSIQGPPSITGGTVAASGTSVTLNFSKTINTYTMSGSPFTIYANGAPVKCSGFAPPTLSGCSPTIPAGAVITASYVPIAGYTYGNGSESLQAASGVSLVNNSTQPADITAPSLIGITMPGTNGQTIVLTYDEIMGGVVPTGDMFTILVDGVASTVSSVSVVGQEVTLTMSPPIELGQSVSVAYTAPTPSNNWADVAAIQDVYGNDAGSITATSIPNTSTAVVDRTAPIFQSAATNSSGTQIILTYDESLSSRTAAPSDYSITLNGMTFSPTAVSVSGSTVVLTVGTNIVSGESVSISYTAPTPSGATTNSAVQDLSGNDAASLTNTSVTNNSNGQPDLTPPAVSTVTYSGNQVTLTLNEPLSSTTAAADKFTVFAGNDPISPTAVTISGQTVVLTLSSSIPAGSIVAVSYTAPSPAVSNSSNAALQDIRGNDALSFNTSNQPTSTSWEWVGGQPSQTCPGAGSAYPNSSKSKLLPNGVTYTVSVTGDYLCIDQATESLSQRGGRAGDFQSVGLVTEPGLMMWTSNNGCVANQLVGRCDNRGVMTISFSKPVTNPVVSFAGWGGGSNGAGWSEMQLLGGMNGSSSVTGARFTALAGTNIEISQNGTVVGNVGTTIPSIGCHKTSGYGADSQAVCGSLQLEGAYTSASFQVNFEYAASNTGSDGGNEDAWNLTASIPEDFGMVPTSYDNPVASHALGSLKLGSVVTADNPSSLYSTTNADAVAAGTEIKTGAKNLSDGDVIVDDGVPQASWSGLVDNRDGETFTIPVTLAGVAETANLCAWIDFNRDGVFTASERSCATSPTVGQTSANISWTIPNDIASGPTYARVRLSYDSLALPSGKVGSGEVEDYSLVIASSAIPSANRDDSIAGKDVNQTISPLTNDQFQQGFANDMTKMFLCLPNETPMNCSIGSGQSLTIPGEGTYTLNPDGTVTFDPVPTFTGTATPIKYQIADTQNRTSSSTINPVVIPTPTGVPDTSSGDYDKDQIINPLSNDIRGSSNYPLVANSMKLCQVDDPATGGNEAQSPNSCSATSVTIPGEGTYTLNSDGTVTFNPLPTFYGTVATPVKYQAQDTLGQFENSTITPTVAQPPTATATDDISNGNYDTNQVIRPLENDSFGSDEQTLLPETVKLCNPATTPPQTSPNCTLTELTTADGTYTVNADGTVTFDPLPTFTGTVATPVAYQVTDALGRKVSANITPTVGIPPAPNAAPETTSGPYNTAQSTTPLTNETPGSASFPLSQSAFKLCAVDDPSTLLTNEAESPNICSATSVTIPGEGTYVYDATTGRITFTPLATFTGEATPIAYQTKDSLDRFVDSTYTPTVGTPPPPVAVADVSSGNYDQNQTITPLSNDTEGSAAFPIDASTIRLCQVDDPSTSGTNEAQTPNNCSVGVNGTVTIPGEGTYTLNADGTVTFDPLPTFAGTVQTPLKYQVADTRGVIDDSTITPTVSDPAPPTADPETTIGKKGATQSTDLLVGDATSDPDITLVPSSVKLCDPTTDPAQVAPNCTLTSLTVPGVGTYTVVNGVMTFTPLSTYVGTPDPVDYQVTDSMGGTATSTYTPTVVGTPTANPDTTTGDWKANQSINVVNNVSGNVGDDVAADGATLDATSVEISCGSAANCTETIVNGVVTEVTIANQGTYTVDAATGDVTFEPLDSFTGEATPVTYTVSDDFGQTATSTYTPTVNPPPAPTATPDTISLIAGSSVPFSSIFDGQTGDSDAALASKATGGPDLTNSTVCIIDPVTSVCDSDGIVVIAGEGTYTLDPVTGIVTYAADANASAGAKTPLTYKISDDLGRSVTETLTPTIYPRPTADDDTSSGAYDTDQTITPFFNDDNVPGHELGTLKLCGLDDPSTSGTNEAQTPNNCDKDTLTTADGVYTVVGNTVVFNPDPDFVGQATVPVRYQAKDDMDQFVNALITPTVLPPAPPTADAETTTGSKGNPQTSDLLDGDLTSDPDITLVPSSVRLCDPTTDPAQVAPNCTLTTLNVPGVGTYTVVNGVMTFTPDANYVGTPTPVSYQGTDSLGGTATSTYTPTVVGTPTASPNTTTGAKGAPQEVSLVENDNAATGATLDPASVKLCDPNPTAEVAPNCTKTTVTVTGVGTYTVDSSGKMTFTPDANYVGTPPALSYTVTDSLGAKASSTYTPTVIGTPTATPDTSSGPQGVAQSVVVVTNDSAASGTTLVSSTVTLSCASAPNCTRNVDGTVTIAGEGTYSAVAADGTVVFTPLPTFTGTATPVTYTVSDALGQSATTTYKPTVIPAPVAVNDTSTNGQDKNQLIDVLDNDTVPTNPAGDPLDPTTVKLCDPTTNPAQVAPNCTLTSLTTADGTYTVNPTTGEVTFDPIPSFTGTVSTPVRYQVSDTGATPQVTSALITPTVIPGPTAQNDTSSGPMNTAQTKTLVTNDSAASGATLDVASVKLCDPNPTAEVAPNCTKTSVTVAGVGTYAVDSSGVMTFTPVNGYSGTPAPLSYTVEDNFDVKATATYTPSVIPPPTVVPDTSTGPWDTNQTRNVIDNNVNTSDSAAPGTTLAAGSVRLCAPTDTAPDCTIDAAGSVVIPNQGTYTVDPATGIVTFDPLPTFKGAATPVTYSVTDALGQKSSTTYTPTVAAPPAPMADPETTTGIKGATQTIDLLPGDTTFDPAITLDPASVKLCGISPAEVMPNCTQSSLTVAGVGTYDVSNGVMTFTPVPNYTGTPAPVSYQVTDSLGGKATSTYTPTVIPPPTVVPDTSTGPWDTNQTRNVVTNNVNTSDSAAAGTTLAAGSVRLCAPSDTAPNCTIDASGSVVIANQGTYTLDPATGIVTFDPLPTFTGTATPVTYSVTDALGQKSSTTYTPTVTVPPAPTATPDTVELIPGQSKVFSSIFDGQTGDADPALATKGTGGPDLTNSSVCLLTPGTTTCNADGIVTIAGEGTYTLDPTTGIVTYAALSSATPGAKTPITYQITDGLNRSVTSTLTPTITPPPVANPDFSTGVQGAIQTLSPVGNDRPGGGASTELFPDTRAQIPSGVFLCSANQPPPDCAASTVTVTDPVTNATLGVLTVAASGLVTFTPEPNFIGTTPPIGYQIPDNLGQKAYSTITITVLPPPAPSAVIDTGSAEYNKPVTLRPWINDSAGAVPAGSTLAAPNLVATSIKLCDDNSTFVAFSGTPADCTATKVRTVEGTYEVSPTTGEVIFTPNPNMVDPITGLPTGKGFVGTVTYPPTYQIWNNWTGLGGVKSATSLLVPTIAPPGAPAATVDITKTKPGTSVVLNPVANDKPGTAALDPTTIRLCGAGEISPSCTQMSVTTLDGLYVVEPTTGQVTFTPRDGFTGQATIPYIIMDGLGMMANANLIITVEDTAVVPVAKKTKVGLAKTGGTRPDLLLLLGLVAIAGAGGLRVLGRKK